MTEEEAAQKDQRIEELEGLLMSALLRIEGLERRLANWIAEAATTLQATQLILKRLLLASPLDHVDETGGRIKGSLHWFHV